MINAMPTNRILLALYRASQGRIKVEKEDRDEGTKTSKQKCMQIEM
jgi:hypothetical protein